MKPDDVPRKPDLKFERFYGPNQEGIEFYTDSECLEIEAWNLDGDVFIIILSPEEVKQLKEFVEKL